MSGRNQMRTGPQPITSQVAIERLELRGISKRFPGVLANDQVDFDVQAGEIHALLGENGAGKSTLMKILYGLYQADEGEILINGRPVRIKSPADALHQGIGMIHQHFLLVPAFTVAENVALGLHSTRGPLLDLDVVAERIKSLSASYGLSVDPHARVWELAVGEQQRVEILKALYRGAALLVLDEPTAVLTPQEVEQLFTVLRRMAEAGHSLIFISHKLGEVLAISRRVTVLRDGRAIGTVPTRDATREALARMMVGRDVLLHAECPPVAYGRARLALRDVWANDASGLPAVRGVSLDVRAGEILGIAGVSGNGQRELAEAIAGLRPITRGSIHLEDTDVTGWAPQRLTQAGLSYVPEERMRDGAIREFSVEENLILRDHSVPPLAQGIFLRFNAIAGHCSRLIRDFDIKTPGRDTLLKHLSGGNIQKLIIARELARRPSVLVAAQPTRGVDIGATEYIHRCLIAQRSEGTATLLISEDLDEVRNLSDRIAVIYNGQIMGVVDRGQVTVEKLGLMMTGVPLEELGDAAE